MNNIKKRKTYIQKYFSNIFKGHFLPKGKGNGGNFSTYILKAKNTG